jgi:glucose/arabinose dehydrogenase
MRARALVIGLFALSSIPTFAGRSTAAPSLPTNFAVDDAVPGAGFVTPTAIAFLPDGRLFVAEKRGRVYEVRNGVRRPTPIWSAEDEVLDAGDRGLLGITVDLKYYVNHYIYLLYVVDPDSTGIDDDPFAFCRLTRYQVNFTDSSTVVAASRTVLLGSDWAHGAVSGSDSHTVGSL